MCAQTMTTQTTPAPAILTDFDSRDTGWFDLSRHFIVDLDGNVKRWRMEALKRWRMEREEENIWREERR